MGVYIMLKNSSDVIPERTYIIHDNTITNVTQSKYGVFVDGGTQNQDGLDYDTDTSDSDNCSHSSLSWLLYKI